MRRGSVRESLLCRCELFVCFIGCIEYISERTTLASWYEMLYVVLKERETDVAHIGVGIVDASQIFVRESWVYFLSFVLYPRRRPGILLSFPCAARLALHWSPPPSPGIRHHHSVLTNAGQDTDGRRFDIDLIVAHR